MRAYMLLTWTRCQMTKEKGKTMEKADQRRYSLIWQAGFDLYVHLQAIMIRQPPVGRMCPSSPLSGRNTYKPAILRMMLSCRCSWLLFIKQCLRIRDNVGKVREARSLEKNQCNVSKVFKFQNYCILEKKYHTLYIFDSFERVLKNKIWFHRVWNKTAASLVKCNPDPCLDVIIIVTTDNLISVLSLAGKTSSFSLIIPIL